MARLIAAQRRFFLFFAPIVITIFIRIVSFSLPYNIRQGRGGIVVSDRGRFKQVAFRFARLHSNQRLRLPLRFGSYHEEANTSYLVRIANFYPFVMIENLGHSTVMGGLVPEPISETLLSGYGSYGCGDGCSTGDGTEDGDGDGDGDGGGDGDGDSDMS